MVKSIHLYSALVQIWEEDAQGDKNPLLIVLVFLFLRTSNILLYWNAGTLWWIYLNRYFFPPLICIDTYIYKIIIYKK